MTFSIEGCDHEREDFCDFETLQKLKTTSVVQIAYTYNAFDVQNFGDEAITKEISFKIVSLSGDRANFVDVQMIQMTDLELEDSLLDLGFSQKTHVMFKPTESIQYDIVSE